MEQNILETELEKKVAKIELSTWKDVHYALLIRVEELYSEIERFRNVIAVNRKHITSSSKRIRIIQRGIKLIEKGHGFKAVKIFKKEINGTKQ